MKLIVNSNFGKTLENKFNRMNAYLCTNEEILRKIASKIQFTGCKIISEKSVIAHSIQPIVKLDRNNAVGFSILELSKHSLSHKIDWPL